MILGGGVNYENKIPEVDPRECQFKHFRSQLQFGELHHQVSFLL